ncbi:MAG: GNAT family N-acetyltransferase [Geminicoccaceae bacterium]
MAISLQTERLLLRAWRDEDLEPFTALNCDPQVMRYFPRLLDRAATAKVVKKMQAHHETYSFGYWPIEVPGVAPFIGIVGLMITPFRAHFTPCIEVAWRLARPYWGQGYATEGARASLTFAFKYLPVLEEVVAFAVPDNQRSLGVMERLGMVRRQEDDFDHPALADGHPLRRHCLYRMSRERWASVSADDDEAAVKVRLS